MTIPTHPTVPIDQRWKSDKLKLKITPPPTSTAKKPKPSNGSKKPKASKP